MSKRSFVPLVALVALFVLSLAACAPAQTVSISQPVTIKLYNLPYISFAPFWIAQDQDYFKAQGLDVQFLDATDQPDAVPVLVSGQVDIASGNMTAGMFNSIARGAQIKFVADKGYVDPKSCASNVIVVRKGVLPATGALTAEQWRSTRVDVQRDSWLEYFIDKAFSPLGLQVDDMKVVSYVPAQSQLEALNNSTIDLAPENEPWVTRMLDAGHQAFPTSITQLMPDAETAVILFGSRLLGQNSDVGKRFMVAYLQAVRTYNEGKTDSNVASVSKYTKLDPALLKRMCWPQLRGDGTLNMTSVLDFQSWAVGKKLVQTPLTAQQIYDSSFVEYAAQHLPTQ